MKSKSQFSIAMHILLALAYTKRQENMKSGEIWMNSEDLAHTIGTHPVVVRRILSRLSKAGIIASRPGREGGVRLKQKTCDLSLDKVLTAIDNSSVVKQHKSPKIKECPISCQIGGIMEYVSDIADHAVKSALQNLTVEKLYSKIKS